METRLESKSFETLMDFLEFFVQKLWSADKLALLAIILFLANVSPTYSSGRPQGNLFNHI